MKFEMEMSMKWAICLLGAATNRNKLQHPVQIITALFCVIHYVNNDRYVPRDEAPESDELLKPRKNNAEFN